MRATGLVFVALLLSGAAHASGGAVEVAFKDPAHFADATFRRPQTEANRIAVQEAVRRMFSEVAARYLSQGQVIRIEVSEIDLAGRFAPMALNDVRIMDSVGWPRIQFNYAVTDADEVIATGEAKLSDHSYLDSFNRHLDSDRLRYERQMLSDWFRRTFPRTKS